MSRKKKKQNKIRRDSTNKDVYMKFISSDFKLDKTELDPINIKKTDESSVSEEKTDDKSVKNKSLGLILKDNSGITILISVLIFYGGIMWYFSVNQGIMNHDVSIIQNDIGLIGEENKRQERDLILINNDFKNFKEIINKELEFIKEKIMY